MLKPQPGSFGAADQDAIVFTNADMDPIKRKDRTYQWYQMGLFWIAEGFNAAQLQVSASAFSLGLNPWTVRRRMPVGEYDRLHPLCWLRLPREQTWDELPWHHQSLLWNHRFQVGDDSPSRSLSDLLRHPNESRWSSRSGLYQRHLAILQQVGSQRLSRLSQYHRPTTPLLLDLLAHLAAISIPPNQNLTVLVRREERPRTSLLDRPVHLVNHCSRRMAQRLEETQHPHQRHVSRLSLRNLCQRRHLRQRHLRRQHHGYLQTLQERQSRMGNTALRAPRLRHPDRAPRLHHGRRIISRLRRSPMEPARHHQQLRRPRRQVLRWLPVRVLQHHDQRHRQLHPLRE